MPVQYSYTCTPPMVRVVCTEPQCLYSRAIPLLPIRAYCLYKASVPVQYSYTSTPPIGRTACTEPQCLYSTAIPLLPLWAVQPVHSLSACTAQLYLYSPYGLYCLYRASVLVQGWPLPLHIIRQKKLKYLMLSIFQKIFFSFVIFVLSFSVAK